jgi:hypothetical protein
MRYGWENGDKDPLVHFYAHWDQLSKGARECIIKHAPHIANSGLPLTQCDVIAPAWYHILRDYGIAADLCGGNYSPELADRYPSLSEHTWLVVDETILDPTASQFGNSAFPIKDEYYRASVIGAREWFDDSDPDEWRFESQLRVRNLRPTLETLDAQQEGVTEVGKTDDYSPRL